MPHLEDFIFIKFPAFFDAHKQHTEKDDETWINLNAFFKIDENWQAYTEYQPRFFDYSKYNGVVLHRAAIGRKIDKGFSAWVGYAFISWNSRRQSKFPSHVQHEDRQFLMLMHNHDSGNWKLSNRTSFEQRMFRYTNEASRRLRHLVRLQYKFGEKPWALAIWDEWFFKTNSIYPSDRSHAPLTKEGFDQNRVFLGLVFVFGDKQQHLIETGYLNNYINGASSDHNANVWMTTVTGKF